MLLRLYKHKWKLLLLMILLTLKNIISIFYFIFIQKTKRGHAHIEDKKDKAKQIIKNDLFRTNFVHNYDRIPWYGIDNQEMDVILTDRKDNVNSRISGCLYSCDVDLEFKIKNISNKYLYSNPLHPDIYPGLIKMESEVIKMVGDLFDLPKEGGGNITTGGTESTILALKAYKKMYKSKSWFNFLQPEVFIWKQFMLL